LALKCQLIFSSPPFGVAYTQAGITINIFPFQDIHPTLLSIAYMVTFLHSNWSDIHHFSCLWKRKDTLWSNIVIFIYLYLSIYLGELSWFLKILIGNLVLIFYLFRWINSWFDRIASLFFYLFAVLYKHIWAENSSCIYISWKWKCHPTYRREISHARAPSLYTRFHEMKTYLFPAVRPPLLHPQPQKYSLSSLASIFILKMDDYIRVNKLRTFVFNE
jgi:hypothetical protein